MKLTPRLKCIGDKIKVGSYPADIGTDHGYIPIYLIKNGICSRAIATDVRVGPLNRAEKNIRMYGLQDKIELRRGEGLSPLLKGEVDCAILAGMGGRLICEILHNDREKAETIDYFIIQPMQAPEDVREYLYKNNFTIYDEELAKEGDKIYQIMAVCHGRDHIDDDIYFTIGKRLIEKKDPLLKEFVRSRIKDTENVINKIDNRNSLNAVKRFNKCKERIKRFEEVLRCL